MTNAQEKSEKGVHLLYKKVGETPKECMERFQRDNPEYLETPMTYAGRLDPMAEGLLLVLSGEKVKEKDEYLGLPKTYICQALWGFRTDTHDLLGLVVENGKEQAQEEEIKKNLEKSIGEFEQAYPAYSSKPVSGKPLFWWAREGRLGEIEIPTHFVEIFKANFISRKTISSPDLLRYIVRDVSRVSGDFRQNEIISKWKEVLTQNQKEEFVIDTIELNVSSGFYVRQFVSDMAEKLGGVATTFHILRTKVGDYNVDN